MDSMGHTSCRASAMNATSPPSVSSCRLTASDPSSRIRPMTALGSRSRPAQKVPRSWALRTWVSRTSADWRACCAADSSWRPSAFRTRTPTAASST